MKYFRLKDNTMENVLLKIKNIAKQEAQNSANCEEIFHHGVPNVEIFICRDSTEIYFFTISLSMLERNEIERKHLHRLNNNFGTEIIEKNATAVLS